MPSGLPPVIVDDNTYALVEPLVQAKPSAIDESRNAKPSGQLGSSTLQTAAVPGQGPGGINSNNVGNNFSNRPSNLRSGPSEESPEPSDKQPIDVWGLTYTTVATGPPIPSQVFAAIKAVQASASLPIRLAKVGGQTVYYDGSKAMVGSQILYPGSAPVIVGGNLISLEASSLAIGPNNVPLPAVSPDAGALPGEPTAMQTASPNPEVYSIDSVPITQGGEAVMISGTRIPLGPSQVIIGAKTVRIS